VGCLDSVHGDFLRGQPTTKIPHSHWLVPRLAIPRSLLALVFGATVGAGFMTFIPAAGFYPLLVEGSPTWAAAALIFSMFGISRFLPGLLVAAVGRRTDTPEVLAKGFRVTEVAVLIASAIAFGLT
jgi:hypothetical protein